MIEFATFFLAMTAYALLATLMWFRNATPLPLRISLTVLVVAHVALVWTYRYEGSIAQATRNGFLGFGVFHAALFLIVAAIFVRPTTCLRVAFVVVTFGALGAVFRYDIVEMYRVPVIVAAMVGAYGLIAAFRVRK